jgi:hypothetical protein
MIVIVYFPTGTNELTVIVHTLVPVSGFGAKARVTPAGAPEYVNVGVGAPSNCVRFMFVVPVPPGATTTIEPTVCSERSTVLPKCAGLGVHVTGFELNEEFA